MAAAEKTLDWSAQYDVSPTSHSLLPGDKISLPPSALEQLLAAAPIVDTSPALSRSYTSLFDPYNPYSYAAERHARSQFRTEQQQLPHPLTFRLVNPANGRAVHAGIKEFSAEDSQVELSPFLLQALGLDESLPKDAAIPNGNQPEAGTNGVLLPRVTIHAKQLAKGTFVKLRPLEAGYNPEDWKSLLEQHLRKSFTTLTKGEILNVSAGRTETFQFLIDQFQPDGDGICVVDTDLEVDIEALNEEQARETLRRIAQKIQKTPGTEAGSSTGGQLNLFKPLASQQILEGEYVDYELPSWPRTQGVEFELDAGDGGGQLDLLVSPFSTRQRARPREEEHVFADFEDRPSKRIRLSPTNVELENAESLYVSVRATPAESEPSTIPLRYSLRASVIDPQASTISLTPDTPQLNDDEVLCKNCLHAIPSSRLLLHESFCLRNNILCPHGCGQVFQKRSPAYEQHWHCSASPTCTSHGSTAASRTKHTRLMHTPIPICPSCSLPGPDGLFPHIPQLAHHATTTCPSKLILCRFCLLEVPQDDNTSPASRSTPDPTLLLTGLTPHEAADGARTTDCDVCAPPRPVRLRDMDTHMAHHNHERLRRPPPILCRNGLCGRTVSGVRNDGNTRAFGPAGGGGNDLGLCAPCFGPLYTGQHDPEGRALKRRLERRLLQQVMVGCGRRWCANEVCCRTGRGNARKSKDMGGDAAEEAKPGVKEATPIVKPFVDGLLDRNVEETTDLPFCVDESTQRRREFAKSLVVVDQHGRSPHLGGRRYGLAWWIGALEAGGGDEKKAASWLDKYGVGVDEEVRYPVWI